MYIYLYTPYAREQHADFPRNIIRERRREWNACNLLRSAGDQPIYVCIDHTRALSVSSQCCCSPLQMRAPKCISLFYTVQSSRASGSLWRLRSLLRRDSSSALGKGEIRQEVHYDDAYTLHYTTSLPPLALWSNAAPGKSVPTTMGKVALARARE